ncbi:hypothetical protein ACIRON_25745 [Nocardioides sp. NPDC101246]|uniref:hypothetical protein n=1 Tax=Nocardioides sp. NPDC101246 TaxID=3364336 RepID=UPI00381490AE
MLAIASPAHAADLTLTWSNPASGWQYQGGWDDSADNLCARTQGNRARVKMIPTNGSGSTYSATTTSGGGGNWGSWACTGNLSIPEDKQYRMELYVWTSDAYRLAKSGNFYS